MAYWQVLLEAPSVWLISINFLCFISLILSILHPNCLLYNKTILCNVWLYFSQYHVISLSLAIIRGRKQLFKSLYKFAKKPKINSEKLVRFFPLIALILDIYKSRHDFNLFVIITMYLPGFYATNFIYTIIEILGVLTIELQRLNKNYPEKHYHLIYKAICNINSNFGLPIFNHVLLTTLTGLFFCYTHTLDAIKCYKQESIVVANVFAPDFWCISTIIATVSLARTTHKLKKIQSSRLDDELHLWQRHLEKMELSAWDLFTIGNHIFIGIAWIILIHVLVLIQMKIEII